MKYAAGSPVGRNSCFPEDRETCGPRDGGKHLACKRTSLMSWIAPLGRLRRCSSGSLPSEALQERRRPPHEGFFKGHKPRSRNFGRPFPWIMLPGRWQRSCNPRRPYKPPSFEEGRTKIIVDALTATLLKDAVACSCKSSRLCVKCENLATR